jgi:hypothetical protein
LSVVVVLVGAEALCEVLAEQAVRRPAIVMTGKMALSRTHSSRLGGIEATAERVREGGVRSLV